MTHRPRNPSRTTLGGFTVLLSVIAIVAAIVAPRGLSMAPERIDTFTEDLSGTDPCNGFDLVSSGRLTVRVTAYFDNQGNPIRVQAHARRDQTLTNSATGNALDLRGSVLVVIDLTTGWQTWLGQVLMSNERGVGSVLQDTGRIVFDDEFNLAFLSGPHDGVTNPEKFCAALA